MNELEKLYTVEDIKKLFNNGTVSRDIRDNKKQGVQS